MATLAIKNISKHYKQGKTHIQALSDISFTLQQKQCIGIIGESGAGKSTLGRIIQGLENSDFGTIFLDDIKLNTLPRLERAKFVQTIFQNPYSSLNPKYTIQQTLNEILNLHNKKKEKLDEILDKLEIPRTLLQRYPHEVSGGQNQRIVIARALIPEPQILIADEPTASLDVSVRVKIIDIFKRLIANKISLIFISHDIKTVSRIADKIIVLYKGKIIESGTSTDILTSPKQPYTKELIQAIPDPSRREIYLD